MKKSTRIVLIVVISILVIAAIVLGAILIIRNHEKPAKPVTPQEEVITGEGGDVIVEDFYNIEVELNEKLIKMFQDVNQEDYKKILHEGETRRIAVQEVMDIYHIDMTEYEPYNCDYSKSYIEIELYNGNPIYGSFLACDWPQQNVVETPTE